MSKTMKNIPKLRFPEFRDAPAWEETPLSKVGEIVTGNTPSTANTANYGGNKLFVSPADISDKRYVISTKTTLSEQGFEETRHIQANSVLFVCIGSTIGKVAQNKFECATNQQINSIIPFAEYSNDFVYSALENNSPQISLLAGNHAVPIINKTLFSSVKILIPDFQEQQKIAECLSSLDALILAQSSKVEALKAHKKALMQQLFPAEGETTPRLRFPEFQNAPEWEKNNFSNYIKLYRGSSPRPIQEYLTKDASGVNWIKIGDTKNAVNSIINKVEEKITQEGAEKSRKVNVGELILANSMSFGKTYELEIEGCIYDGWFVLREYEEYFYKPFLLQLLNSEYMQQQYQKLSAGGIVQNISSDIVYETILFYTSIKEQQKIAECLSSLDTLISAQSSKVEALKQHKKALMQQLFPTCKVTS